MADAILRTSPDESFFVEGRDALNQPVRETQWLFGADSRTSTTNVNPFRQTVHFSNNCSGVWIGHHTIITAAHCLYDTATNTFKTPIVLTTYKQGPANNGIGTPINLSDPSVGNGVAVPAAFDAGTTNNWEWDYAVIDLTGYATSPVGWNGYWVNYSGQAQKGYGYPKSGTSQATVALCPGRATDGYLCGMSGNGEVNGYRFESWDIDITAGQSGGPWLASTNHTIGTVIGEVSYPDLFKCGLSLCFRNVARRIDNAYWNWIVAWSADH